MKRLSTLRSMAVASLFSLAAAGCAAVRPPKPAEASPQPVRIEGCAQYYQNDTIKQIDITCLEREGQIKVSTAKLQSDMQVADAACKEYGRKSVECVIARHGTYGEEETRAIYKAEFDAVTRVRASEDKLAEWMKAHRRQPVAEQAVNCKEMVALLPSAANSNQPSSLAGKIIASANQNQTSSSIVKKILHAAKEKAPETLASAGTSWAVRAATTKALVAAFGLTATTLTVPVAAGLLSMVAAGAIRGGFRRVRAKKEAYRNLSNALDMDLNKPVEGWLKQGGAGWWTKEFIGGMGEGIKETFSPKSWKKNWKSKLLWGGIGATVAAAGVAFDYFRPGGVLHELANQSHHAAHAGTGAAAHVAQQHASTAQSALQHTAPPAPSSGTAALASHGTSAANAAPQPESLKDIGVDDQIKGLKLSDDVKNLAKSHNAKDLLKYYKAVSYELLNHSHTKAAHTAGAKIAKLGADLADKFNMHDRFANMLRIDAERVKSWGWLSRTIAAPTAG
jgi:hypothetical protein